MTMPAGASVSGYTIERVLGAGGMGTVYLARHPTLPRSVALKVLSAELSADPDFRSRFRREADLAASLDHPNVVRVYTRGEAEDGRLWIAMQFIDGTDAGALADDGPIPIGRTLHIIGEVAKALDYAHSRKLLHRDIKPANFLLTGKPGPQERVLLADFGIARAVEEATRLTATGAMMATVAYAAPEAVEGRPVDHRADLYSLGCALFRMLAGRTPFQDAGTMSAIMMAHLTRPAPPVTAFAPQLPQAINAVMAIALAKDPADRFNSARELSEAAHNALLHGQYPERAVPQSTAPVTSSDAHTYPSGMFSGPAATPSQPTGRRRRRWMIAGAVAAVVAVVAGVLLATTGKPDKPPYPAQTFNHAFGSTRVDQRPDALATLTLSDADIALSLGVQPVAMVVPRDEPPVWLADLIDGSPTLLSRVDAKDLEPVAPDLILDTGAVTKQQYDQLAKVAPTIVRPNTGGRPFTAETRLSWVATVLGEQVAADSLRTELNAEQEKVRAAHSNISGPTVTVFAFSDDGLTAKLSGSPAASYLSSIGMTYNTKLASGGDGSTEKPVLPSDLYDLKTDIAIVLRSDEDAGSGGFYGLPEQLEGVAGLVMIVDEPDTLAAFDSGGPAATRYLDKSFVPKLNEQLR